KLIHIPVAPQELAFQESGLGACEPKIEARRKRHWAHVSLLRSSIADIPLTVVRLDILETLRATDTPVHLGEHHAGLGMEDAQARIRKTDRVPEPIDSHLGGAVRGEAVDAQMRAPRVDGDDDG